MAKARYWQARVTYPGERILTFGVQASGLPQALLKTYQQAFRAGVADHITVERLYGMHHPLRRQAQKEKRPWII